MNTVHPASPHVGRSFKKAAAAFLCIVLAVSLCSCSHTTSSEKLTQINDRLELLDEYSAQHSSQDDSGIRKYYETDTFRSIAFGSYKSDVINAEKLPLLEEGDNYLTYSKTLMFNYGMNPTYWFNNFGELYCGSYHMITQLSLSDTVDKMSAMLTGLYGEPTSADYYDKNFYPVVPSEDESIASLVNSGQAVYFAWFSYSSLDIELRIEINDTQSQPFEYFVTVYYVDSSYYY